MIKAPDERLLTPLGFVRQCANCADANTCTEAISVWDDVQVSVDLLGAAKTITRNDVAFCGHHAPVGGGLST